MLHYSKMQKKHVNFGLARTEKYTASSCENERVWMLVYTTPFYRNKGMGMLVMYTTSWVTPLLEIQVWGCLIIVLLLQKSWDGDPFTEIRGWGCLLSLLLMGHPPLRNKSMRIFVYHNPLTEITG